MREIYYKEGVNINNKRDFILKLFSGKKFPTTYYKDTDFIQCRSTYRRSFLDIYWLFKSKFKTATKGELARILLDKRNHNIGMFYCDDINKLVLDIRTGDKAYDVGSFINDDPNYGGTYFLNEEFLKEGPSFSKVVKYATRSSKFKLTDINISKHVKL